MYDAIVIGAGPAGISAALYIKRANLNVAVLYHGESQLEKAHKIDNYYGFPQGISGKDLYAAGIEQAKGLDIPVIDAEVTNIQMTGPNVYTVSADKDYECSSVIIAVGNKKLRPDIKGIQEFEGKGVSYCAVCDGFFYRGKKVFVIGNGLYAFEEAHHLAHIASEVTILTNGHSPEELSKLIEKNAATGDSAVSKITVNTGKIAEIKGNAKVEEIVFEDACAESGNADTENNAAECTASNNTCTASNNTCTADGVFVALGSAGGADFAKKLGLILDGDSIKTDEKMKTNAPGIFSCGNVNGGLLQICKAVYEGGIAGLSAIEYVRGLKKQNA